MFRLIGTIILCLLLCSVTVDADTPLTLTLSQAIDCALAGNHRLKAEAQDLEQAKGERLGAFKSVLPRAETSAFYRWNLKKNVIFFPNSITNSVDTIELGKDRTVDFRAQLTQPLFDFGGMIFAMRSAGLGVQAERAALDDARHTLIYETTVLYHRVQYSETHAESETRALHQSENSLGAMRAKRQAELVSPLQILNAEATLEAKRVAALEADHQLQEARNELATLLALPADTAIAVTDPIALPPAPPPFTAVLEQATAQNPFLRELKLTSKALKSHWRAAQTTWAPRLDGQANYGVQGETDDSFPSDDEFVTSKSVALVASFPVFDGLAREGEIKKAKAAYVKSVYELDQSVREFQNELEKTYHSLAAARAQVTAQEKAHEAAEAAYRDAEAEHANGLITTLDLNQARLLAEQASVRALQAAWNAIGAQAYLNRLIGGSYDHHSHP